MYSQSLLQSLLVFTACSFFLIWGNPAQAQWDQSNPSSSTSLTRSGSIRVGSGGSGTRLTVDGDGRAVVIKRNSPTWDQTVARFGISVNTGVRGLRFQLSKNGGSTFTDVMHLDGDGRVGIGTTNTQWSYKLAVKGKIGCEELIVKPVGFFPDYVFRADYELLSLNEVEAFIQTEGRLPNMPEGDKIDTSNELPVGELTLLQQEKIEEIFLHLIRMEKEMKELKAENEALRAKVQQKVSTP